MTSTCQQLRRPARRVSRAPDDSRHARRRAYGLYTKSDGTTNFTLLQTPSFGTLSGTTYSGAANSIPYVSPLVTDEIMYNPTQPTAAEAAAGYADSDFEYVELYNRSSSPVALGNYYVAGGIGYTPGWLADGLPGEFETLESGATATWSASSLASPRTPSTPI